MSNNQEIELRYQVTDVPALLGRLEAINVQVVAKERIVDEWYAPTHLKNLDEEQQWFENENGVAWRIRRVEKNGASRTVRDSKQLPAGDVTHTTFIESTPEVIDYHKAVTELTEQKYRNWLTIDKTRYTLSVSGGSSLRDVSVTIDEIDGLAQKIGVGAVIEIEYTGNLTSFDEIIAHLKLVAKKLGFDDEQRFEKSLTVAAKPALADFSS